MKALYNSLILCVPDLFAQDFFRICRYSFEHSLRVVPITEVRMSKKHESHGQKKKLTKKELKAINHAKLMANKGSSNVVELNAHRDENKKAA